MPRHAYLIIAFLTYGCGPEFHDAELLSDGLDTDNVKVAIGNANPGAVDEYKIAAAFDSPMSVVKICEYNGSSCVQGSEHVATLNSTVGTRSIYEIPNYMRATSTTTYAISYVKSAGLSPSYFRFKFTPANAIDAPNDDAPTWKALFVTGDMEFNAWDNARKKLVGMFQGLGVKTENIRELSMQPREQTNGVGQTSKTNIQNALQELSGGKTTVRNEHCLVFMTSHGSKQGFFLRNQGTITPGEFAGYLDATCGTRPTVAIISACYSGVMISPEAQKPNRIILTAASRDKTSFGCDAKSTYTFYDQCVIETLPKAQDWNTFADLNTECVRNLERERGMPHFSDPQAFFGADVQNLAMPK